MKREKYTKKLVRMIEAIEAGGLPAKVRALYVFGSYARGALEPGDLDVIVVYKWPSRATFDAWVEERVAAGEGRYEAVQHVARWVRTAMKAAFRRPGERVHLLLEQSLDGVVGKGSAIKPADAVLLWSEHDRNWRVKLASLQPDSTAGRAPRNHFFPLERLRADLGDMKEVAEMIADRRLLLTQVPVESMDLTLDADHRHWLEHWTKCKILGKESIKTLPYAMLWFQMHRQRCAPPQKTEIWSRSHTHRAEMGRPSLARMLSIFQLHGKVRRQCLIPHFKTAGPNALLVFERGPKWSTNRRSERLPR